MTSPSTQSLTDEIRRMAEARGMTPIELLKDLVARENVRQWHASEATKRLAMRNHKLRLVKA